MLGGKNLLLLGLDVQMKCFKWNRGVPFLLVVQSGVFDFVGHNSPGTVLDRLVKISQTDLLPNPLWPMIMGHGGLALVGDDVINGLFDDTMEAGP